jgi:hypothetical protein
MTLPHDVTREALVGGVRKLAAQRTGVSIKTVDAWCVPPVEFDGNGLPAPAQRVIESCLAAAESGHPHPFLLVDYINRETGHLPPVRIDAEADPAALDCIATMSKEFSDVIAEFARAHADGRFTATEAEPLLIQVEDLMGVLMPLCRALHRVVVEDEAARERGRRGPHRPLPRFLTLRERALRQSIA